MYFKKLKQTSRSVLSAERLQVVHRGCFNSSRPRGASALNTRKARPRQNCMRGREGALGEDADAFGLAPATTLGGRLPAEA
jgi:hypothetical protein